MSYVRSVNIPKSKYFVENTLGNQHFYLEAEAALMVKKASSGIRMPEFGPALKLKTDVVFHV